MCHQYADYDYEGDNAEWYANYDYDEDNERTFIWPLSSDKTQ